MIKENSVVTMSYTLRDDAGNVLDQSNGQPFEFLQGHGNIIPGLEKQLMGLNVGDKRNVQVQAEEAYGVYNPELRFSMNAEQFGETKPEPGMMVQFGAPEGGSFMASVIGTEDNLVILDANHPLAGKTLHFDVEIQNIREASAEELQHGHPHGPHGHHH